MKKFIGITSIVAILIVLLSIGQVLALEKGEATSIYAVELEAVGMSASLAKAKADKDVADMIASMQADQSAVSYGYGALAERVDKLLQNDTRREGAESALEAAEAGKDAFTAFNAENSLYVQMSIAGAPPLVTADESFTLAQQTAEQAQNEVNRILIAPTKPASVPAGDIISDFLPQIIRQLFRFAWLAILVAFTVSGVMLVIANGEDEKLTKAKSMIYYTLIGFAFVTLAFAMVKAVTDIDFFRFI